MITSAEIRQRFLRFFQERGHTVVSSSSLLPGNDPTLLFTNAGMVQFKDVFTGSERRPYTRAASAQKCMRVSGKHNDLQAVGPSPRHQTFFEMLGNFSFGDYFKREAIQFAWTFLTQELGLPADQLYPTVYVEDDDAFTLWQEIAGIPAKRISRLGAEDNYWAMGDTGPCGPDSEIMYDRGPQACTCGRPDCSPAIECDRWLELWNLVFMQYETLPDGTVIDLPRPSIDTGLGLERITSVLQGADNNYDTDVFIPIMERTRQLVGNSPEEMRTNVIPYRVIADHSRAIAFLISDGVMPGNEGRGYVLRMILRRAARFGRLLGIDGPFLAETTDVVVDTMGSHYTELVERRGFLREVVTQEEERFLSTLSVGISLLDQMAERLKREGQRRIPGREAFRLYDTYGFPIELTRDAAQDLGLSIDEEGFDEAMAEQRERARSAQRFALDRREEAFRTLRLPPTTFVGYDTTETTSSVLALLRDDRRVTGAQVGDEIDVVLEKTPFYAEAGGQVGDQGEIAAPGLRCQVFDASRPTVGLIAHRCRVLEGTIHEGDSVCARIDVERRLDIARNHTATHLLHRALRKVLGEHAAQSGSLVAPDRLRFDFGHLSRVTDDELRQIEDIVNAQIRANRPIRVHESSFDEAVKSGATALFGEKYADRVRVVNVEGFGSELCGGTHLSATGEIGVFLITSESSIGSGLRRVEAVSGRGAIAFIRKQRDTLTALDEKLGARPGEEIARATSLMAQLRDQRHMLEALRADLASVDVERLAEQAASIDGVRVLSARTQAPDAATLRTMSEQLRDLLGSSVVALGTLVNDKPLLVVTISQDLLGSGLHAGRIAGRAAKLMGGGGGGRPHMAQAGGKDASQLDRALGAVTDLVSQGLQGK